LADVDPFAETVDVLYDEEGVPPSSSKKEKEGEEEEEDVEEEDNVPISRIFPLAASSRLEQSKVLLNMARCLLKSQGGRLWDALVHLGLVVAILAPLVLVVPLHAAEEEEGMKMGAKEEEEEAEEEEREEATRLLVSAYEVRCKALCRGGDFRLAKLDARRILKVAAVVGGERGRGLGSPR
jgi:ribosomal protein L12E/L44/L45/RPP1/RPP2